MKYDTNYAVFDFETTPIETGVQKFLIGAIYYDNAFFIAENIDTMLDYILQCPKEYCFAHNISYDYRFLINPLRDRKIIQDILITNSDILRVKLSNKNITFTELRDSFALFRQPLSKLSENNKEYSKKELPFKEICQIILENNPKFDFGNKEAIELVEEGLKYQKSREIYIDYLKYDCLSLFEVIQNYQEFLEKDKLRLTVASNSMREFREYNQYKIDINTDRFYNDIDGLFRKTYFGGRTEVFRNYGKNLFYYDFNSLYPSVMENNYFPVGEIYEASINEDISDYPFYIANIDIDLSYSYITNMPYRHNKKLFFGYGVLKNVWFNSIEINHFLSQNANIKFNKIYVWVDKAKIFNKFINKYYTIREKAKKDKNESATKFSKDIMNSLSGKFAQNTDFNSIAYINDEDLAKVVEEYKSKGKLVTPLIDDTYIITEAKDVDKTTTYISSFITSYARLKLWNKIQDILKLNGKVYYCDTDSIITDLDFRSECSTQLGDLKIETDKDNNEIIEKAVFVLPKLYALKYQDGDELIKVKGFYTKNNTFNDIERLFNTPLHEQYTTISKIRRIAKKELNSLECYDVSKDIKYSNAILKRKYANNDSEPINFEVLDI